ncbi:MAG: hypothetical protein EA415_11320 [Sphaerobacteraceae bacterium]|nr:MAG: hypothetical protein EA415_11320 [Sphaerobacteraceae bacterium]
MMSVSRDAARFLAPDMMGSPDLCVSATAHVRINAPVDEVYDWFCGLDISRVLNGYGPLPGVERTTEQTGSWTTPRETRKLEMSGNIRARQEILIAERPFFFAYRVREFTHILNLMAYGAEARWWFEPDGDGGMTLTWTYTFWPRSFVGKLGIYPVIKTIWHRYMVVTIRAMRDLAEQEIHN